MSQHRRHLLTALLVCLGLFPYRGMGLSSFVQSSTRKGLHSITKNHFQSTSRRRYTTKSPIIMMPEGPEVRILVEQIQGAVGRRLVNVQFLSGRYVRTGKPPGFDAFASTMTSLETSETESVDLIMAWKCKGKFIYIFLDDGGNKVLAQKDPDFQRSIWITLGMTGKFLSEAANAQDDRYARWYMELLDLETSKLNRIYYHDARNFGTLKFCTSRQQLLEKLQSLGPDIFNVTESDFVNIVSVQKPELNISKFLMDQSKIAGIGNYILSEGLYRAGIDPFASLQELDDVQCRMLFRELQAVACESYEAQGMTRGPGGQYRNVDGKRGQFEFQLQCYGRDFCALGRPVRKEVSGPHGRTIWYIDDQLFMPRADRLKMVHSERGISTNESDSQVPTGEATVARVQSELLSALREPSWKNILSVFSNCDTFHKLTAFLAEEEAGGFTVYPPREDIFNALNLCPFDRVKVVIVGQDPYHGPGQGHGLAFSVRKGIKPPPSLNNIFREAMDDVGIEAPQHGNLEHWAKQGVLLLNAVLTVRRGKANSHSKHGWEEFTDQVIRQLNEESDGLVFLLWGNPAAKKAKGVDEEKHIVIRTSHPSPLGATKTASPFLGSRCFSRANAALIEMGKEPIDWTVE